MSGAHPPIVRLLLDEDLSPYVAQRLTTDDLLDAIHVRDRGRLGATDREVLQLALGEDRILVTANVRDFHRLAAAIDVHAGIVLILDGALNRAEQLALLREAVALIVAELTAGRDLTNRVIRVAQEGTRAIDDLPVP